MVTKTSKLSGSLIAWAEVLNVEATIAVLVLEDDEVTDAEAAAAAAAAAAVVVVVGGGAVVMVVIEAAAVSGKGLLFLSKAPGSSKGGKHFLAPFVNCSGGGGGSPD